MSSVRSRIRREATLLLRASLASRSIPVAISGKRIGRRLLTRPEDAASLLRTLHGGGDIT